MLLSLAIWFQNTALARWSAIAVGVPHHPGAASDFISLFATRSSRRTFVCSAGGSGNIRFPISSDQLRVPKRIGFVSGRDLRASTLGSKAEEYYYIRNCA